MNSIIYTDKVRRDVLYTGVPSRSIITKVIKLLAFELAAKFSRQGEDPVQPRLCNAKNAIFKRLKNGVFPSLAIFAGQLKRNLLYMETC
jgi:hypothetical protein